MQIYNVRTSFKPEDKPYAVHRNIKVAAHSLMDAVRQIHLQIPEANIWSVAHQGTVTPEMVTQLARESIE